MLKSGAAPRGAGARRVLLHQQRQLCLAHYRIHRGAGGHAEHSKSAPNSLTQIKARPAHGH